MTDPLHVAPGIVGFLDAPNHVRIRAIRTERWIGFGRARRVIEHLGALCEYPPSTRPPGLAIYGHSGMGKAMLVEKFRRDHPPAFNSAVWLRNVPGPRHFLNLAANGAARLRAVAHGARS